MPRAYRKNKGSKLEPWICVWHNVHASYLVAWLWNEGMPERCPVHVGRMATETQEVDIVDLEQTRIRRAMRHMAVQAAFFGLYRSMLKDERAHSVGVALGADCKLTGGGAHLAAHLGPMGIMTVAALYEPDIDPMAIRPGELSPLRTVTSVTQLGLRFDEEEIDILRAVRTVTVGASDAAGEVFGVGKVLRFQTGLVTFRADRRRIRWTQLLKANDLGRVATTVNVRLPGSVTSLASMLVALEQRCMWCARKMLVPHFLVARLANFCVGVWAAC